MFSFTKGSNRASLLNNIFVINRANTHSMLKYIEGSHSKIRNTKVDVSPKLVQPLSSQAQPISVKSIEVKQFNEPANSQLVNNLSSGEATNLIDVQQLRTIPPPKKDINTVVDKNVEILRPNDGLVAESTQKLVSIKKIRQKQQKSSNKRRKTNVYDYI